MCYLIYISVLISTVGLELVQCNDKQFDYVPDVVGQPPESTLSVKFGDVQLNPGDELTPTLVKDQPSVSWSANPEDYYTVCMTDPDAPSRQDPKVREFLHWLVVNIPGNATSDGEAIAQYVGSGPPKGTGLHRYVLLLFKQPEKLSFDEVRASNTSRAGRKNFSIQKFSEKYRFQQPAVAGNYYVAQWDEYVPTVHKQLSGE